MFWVISSFTMPRRSSSATARCAGFGWMLSTAEKRGRWKLQKRSGLETKVDSEPTSIGSTFSQIPPGERKSGMPLSVETPAPVSTTACRASASRLAR